MTAQAPAHSELIGQIYESAMDSGLWPQALSAVRKALRGCNSSLALYELSSGGEARILLDINHGMSDYWLKKREDLISDVYAFWRAALEDPERDLDAPLIGTAQATWRSNRYVTEWALPQGIIDAIAFAPLRGQRFGAFGFGRHSSEGPITEQDIALARQLGPHLRRALQISNLLDAAKIAATDFERALDALTVGVFLLDETGGILHANAAASKLLSNGGAFHAPGNKLSITHGAGRMLLAKSLDLAGRQQEMGRLGIAVPAIGVDGEAHVAHVLPLSQQSSHRSWVPRATVAVFVGAGSDGSAAVTDAFQQIYDLTAAEARVMTAIASGISKADAARQLNISENTVKTHLARVFDKTGVKRSSELARLAQTLSLPVQAAPLSAPEKR